MTSSAAPLTLLFVIVLSYLLGSIPFGLLLTRAAGLGDIRAIGSGNIGATNVLRTGRKGLAAATLLLDALKGALAVLIGVGIDGPVGALICGLAAIVGHLYPVWLGFRGGKGVATGFGVLIAANPIAGLAAGAVWIAMAKLFKFSSLSALTSYAAAPVLMAIVTRNAALTALAVAVAVLVWLRHIGNIQRLLAGTEPRIGQK
jgi:glycerol-3-phosphate acyltransferase PlsY